MLRSKKRVLSFCKLILFLLFFLGCASSASREKAPSASDYVAKRIEPTKGEDFFIASQLILSSRFQYEIARTEETSQELYLETSWKNRYPFEDEIASGVVQARSRIILRARPSYIGPADPAAQLYNLDFHAENEVLLESKDEWLRLPMSKMLRQYFDRIVGDLKTEVQNRRFRP
ncbi:hypothetical protein L0337_15490 [candidate division KSB1 bacterium]|nr:hypothetical protein [candidate division KSB1 bacterium]